MMLRGIRVVARQIGTRLEKKRVYMLPFYSKNPYQIQLANSLRAMGVDVVPGRGKIALLRCVRRRTLHLHWLHPFFQPRWMSLVSLPALTLQLFLSYLRRERVIWTLHNEMAHEKVGRSLELLAGRLVARASSGVIVHTKAAAHVAAKRYSVDRCKIHILPHGHYHDWYPSQMPRFEARRTLGIPEDALVFAFVGNIRSYKGVSELIEAFRSLPMAQIQLVIAGQAYDDYLDRQIAKATRDDPRCHYFPGYVGENDIQKYINASDAIVLPYRRVLTSGAALLAMSFGKACIASKHPGLVEVLTAQGAIFYDMQEPDGLRSALIEAIERTDELPKLGQRNKRVAIGEHDWGAIARQMKEIYFGS